MSKKESNTDWLGAIAKFASGLPGGKLAIEPILHLKDKKAAAKYKAELNFKIGRLLSGQEIIKERQLEEFFQHEMLRQQTDAIEKNTQKLLGIFVEFCNQAQQLGKPPEPGQVWHVPPRLVPHFTHRKGIVNELRRTLTSGKQTAITQQKALYGLGGIGKTQVALKYVHDYGAEYEVVFWLRAEEHATLVSDYMLLGEKLGLSTSHLNDQTEIVSQIRNHLESRENWLLIFDNTKRPDEIDGYLPQGKSGHVIVTSRNPDWEMIAQTIKVDEFTPWESQQFLNQRTGLKDDEGAEEVAKQLGNLPLALDQAAAYIKKHGVSFEGYLKRLAGHSETMLNFGKNSKDYPFSVAASINLSLAALRDENPHALDLLTLCAFMAPDEIPLHRFEIKNDLYDEKFPRIFRDTIYCDEVLGQIRSYSLMEYQGDQNVSIHRLVQAVLRDQLDENYLSAWMELSLRLVSNSFPFDEDDTSTWNNSHNLLPHLLACLDHCEKHGIDYETCGTSFIHAALFLKHQGRFILARELLQRSIAIHETAYDPKQLVLATSYSNLALVETELGNLKQARELLQRAIAIDEKALEPEHPRLATVYSNLAQVEKIEGNIELAQNLVQKSIAIYEKAFNPDDPMLATCYSNLALLEKNLGNSKLARELLQLAIDIDVKAFDLGHPTLATRYSNLATIEHDLRNLKRARELLQLAIEINVKAFDPEHPTLATNYSNLALVEQDLGNHVEAVNLMRKAYSVRKLRLGLEHPRTKSDVKWLTMFDPEFEG